MDKERLLKLMKEIEWIEEDEYGTWCPSCGNNKDPKIVYTVSGHLEDGKEPHGHDKDCEIDDFIKLLEAK